MLCHSLQLRPRQHAGVALIGAANKFTIILQQIV